MEAVGRSERENQSQRAETRSTIEINVANQLLFYIYFYF